MFFRTGINLQAVKRTVAVVQIIQTFTTISMGFVFQSFLVHERRNRETLHNFFSFYSCNDYVRLILHLGSLEMVINSFFRITFFTSFVHFGI